MRAVSLSACGVVCAFGAGEAVLWQGLRRGACALQRHSSFLHGQASVAQVPAAALARVAGGAGARRDRTVQLVSEAAHQLMEQPAWRRVSKLPPERVGISLGTTQGPIQSWTCDQLALQRDATHRPALPTLTTPAWELARQLGAAGPFACPSMACASGTVAIALGSSWIRCGLCDAVVAGGADALSALVYHGFASLHALDPERPRPFDQRRAGLGLGEGAGLVLLEAGELAGAPRVLGAGLSADANHLTGPDPSGAGVVRAVNAALREAGLAPAQIDFINAHGTATVYNDLMEAKAFGQVFGARSAHVPVNSIKGAIGHTMGAAGAIEAILCALVLRHGEVPPTAGLEQPDPALALAPVYGDPRAEGYRVTLSTSSGFGGVNAALIIASGAQ